MGACRKKPAQPASGTLSWMTPSETLLRLCLGGFGDMKWAWGGGWRLPAFLCQTTSSPGFCPISRAHFRDRKTLRNECTTRGLPCCFDLHFDRFDGFIFEAEKPFENVYATGASPVPVTEGHAVRPSLWPQPVLCL